MIRLLLERIMMIVIVAGLAGCRCVADFPPELLQSGEQAGEKNVASDKRAPTDAPVRPPDLRSPDILQACTTANCPPPGQCKEGLCEIDCGGSGGIPDCHCGSAKYCRLHCHGPGCATAAHCDNALVCEVNCTEDNACKGPIFCDKAAYCSVDCSDAKNTCTGSISCSTARCEVSCAAPNCAGGIDCQSACSCSVTNCSSPCAAKCIAGCQTSSGCKKCPCGTGVGCSYPCPLLP